ncbi:hypothetical protein ACEPPN_019445 [Leptodophora sp. 'Broadleaf-Isolate-01']
MADQDQQSSGAVNPQWEVSHTAFSTANTLRDLIRIASKPNVQPQAILAAENLGYGLVASPTVINEAITALGGNTSVHLESIQGAIGLRSQDLQQVFRQSTPLLQFFLMVTACKPCYNNSELGDLVFHMMAKTKVLRRFPASSSQMTQLINTFSGHSEMIVPVSHMHELAVAVSAENLDMGLYDRMDPTMLAELMVCVFENFVDEAIVEMTLRCRIHAVWLATLFSWLLPESTHVKVREKTIRGGPGMRLTVEIAVVEMNFWELEVYKSDADVSKYVFKQPQDEIMHLHRLPLNQARSFFDDHYTSSIEEPGKRSIAIQTMGELARSLVIYFIENCRLFRSKDCCADQGKKCLTAPILQVISDSALATYSDAMRAYGWDSAVKTEIAQASKELQERLREHARHAETADSPKTALSSLSDVCSEWVTKVIDSACDASYIVDPAMYLALDAVVTSTVQSTAGTRYFSPMTAMDLEKTDDVVSKLLWRDGLDVQEFRATAFKHLLPGLPESHTQDLAVSYGGYTVAMNVLWKPSTQPRSAIGIRYAPGHIEKDGTQLSRVREANFSSYQSQGKPVATTLFKSGQYTPLTPQTSAVSFETHTAIHGDQLTLKHYMTQATPSQFWTVTHETKSDTSMREKALWTSAIDVLAMATHVDRGNDLTPIQEIEMAKHLHGNGLQMIWCAGIPLLDIEDKTKALLRTSGDEKLRFFAASKGYDKYVHAQRCFAVVVRQNAPLLSCIRIAEESKGAWVVIT